ncbi:MAG: ABC transporter permease [Acidobacteriia bacterium]|nr:ABC transporter permease [Terriglobia bacterium]
MDTWFQNIRYAFRVIRRSPGVTAVVVLALALGIGANIGIFSVVNAVLLRPLPYKDSDRLVQIWGQMLSRNVPYHFVPYPDFAEWREQSRSFESMSAYRSVALNLTNRGEPRRLNCLQVNAGFFHMVGVPLLHGRGFLQEEDKPGAQRVAVMNHPLWQQAFGSDANIVGQSLTLDGNSYTIVGVLPGGFQFGGTELDLYVPLAASSLRNPQGLSVSVGAYARLKPGLTLKTAQADIDTITARLNQQYPGGIPRGARVWGLREFMVRDVRLSLWILAGAVGLVLLIACANVANILLARADVRRREMAIRAALGADRRRIVRQILSESVVLGLAGGVLGILLALWGINTLVKTSSGSYPLLRSAALDATTLAFALTLSLVTGVMFGIVPALTMAQEGSSWGVLSGALKEGSSTVSATRSSKRIRALLVVFEVALSLMLLIAAGLLVRSFFRLQQVNPGFDARGVLTANITLPQERYPTGPKRLAIYQEFLQNLARAPEVEAAGLVDLLPLSGSNSGTGLIPEGRAVPRPGEIPIVWLRFMSEDYFRAMSIPLLSGRQFSERDNPPAPPVAIINRTLARRFWPGEDPLGKRFTLGAPGPNVPAFTVVGLAGDVRHTNLIQEPDAELFLYYRQLSPMRVTVAVRTRSDPSRLGNTVRQALSSVDKDLAVARIQTMEKILTDSISSRRLTMLLLSIFAAVALILAAVGIYGVISYSVAQRRHEIGIRMALGAPGERVLWMVTGQAMLLAGAGEVVGLAAAFALRRLIESQLYGSTVIDPAIFTAVPLILGAVALVAAIIPARRAMQVDPLIALRRE